MRRVPSGQEERSTRPVSSQTSPLERSDPSWSSAETQAFSGTLPIAAHRLGQVIANREANPRVAAPIGKLVRGASGVGAQQQLDLPDELDRDLRQRLIADSDLIDGVFAPALPGRRIPASASLLSSQ